MPARFRVGVAMLLGGAVGAVSAPVTPWEVAILIGWISAAAIYLGGVWWSVWNMDGQQTRRHAMALDQSRVVADTVLILASVVSLVAVGFDLSKASTQTGLPRALETLVAVLSVGVSWADVHVVFMLKYADLYYQHGGGIDFHGPSADNPTFRDFAYIAFTIGMTYQVSDTDITAREIRRYVFRHALLSFVFGTAIIATMVNVVAGLLNH